MITLNSMDLCKKLSSSNSINSFMKFLQKTLSNEEIEVKAEAKMKGISSLA